MQNTIDGEEMDEILRRSWVASLGTVDSDGTPYVTPIHFAWVDGEMFFHGRLDGKKMDNIRSDSRVCVTVYEMDDLIMNSEGNPCNVNTGYRSIILRGNALMMTEPDEKRRALGSIVSKYTPELHDKPLPDRMVDKTAVVRIVADSITGRCYRP